LPELDRLFARIGVNGSPVCSDTMLPVHQPLTSFYNTPFDLRFGKWYRRLMRKL